MSQEGQGTVFVIKAFQIKPCQVFKSGTCYQHSSKPHIKMLDNHYYKVPFPLISSDVAGLVSSLTQAQIAGG